MMVHLLESSLMDNSAQVNGLSCSGIQILLRLEFRLRGAVEPSWKGERTMKAPARVKDLAADPAGSPAHPAYLRSSTGRGET
jgi:hypothetical protein